MFTATLFHDHSLHFVIDKNKQSVYGTILALPRSKMGEALAYAMNQRKHLENVLLDGRLELSNNRSERSIKPFVIGRNYVLPKFMCRRKGSASQDLVSCIQAST